MPIVDHAARLITCKLVLYGPGRSGKTTNLTWLHSPLPSSRVGALSSVATRHGRTHAFDYTPGDSAEVGAFRVAFRLHTMSGEARSSAAREALTVEEASSSQGSIASSCAGGVNGSILRMRRSSVWGGMGVAPGRWGSPARRQQKSRQVRWRLSGMRLKLSSG